MEFNQEVNLENIESYFYPKKSIRNKLTKRKIEIKSISKNK